MNVLVIGGAGYVGSVVTYELWNAGHNVTVLDSMLFGCESLVPLIGQSRFRLARGDIRDQETVSAAVAGHDVVLLFAAIVGEPACNRAPDLAKSTNLDGARHVLKACEDSDVERLIFASTCSNYGISDSSNLATEQSPLKPISIYSETKVQAEKEILASSSPRLCTTVIRLSTAFGVSPRMRFDLLVSDFSLAAHRDRKIVIFGEQFWRPFVHVKDIANAAKTVAAAERETVSGQVFNIGRNDNNLQKLELGELVQQQVEGVEIEIVKRDTDPRSYRVDFSCAEHQLGIKPEWTVQDGVREVTAAFGNGVWPDPTSSKYKN